MFGDKTAAATIPVKDIKAARRFYEDTLGLKLNEQDATETS